MFTGLIECCALVEANTSNGCVNNLIIHNPFPDAQLGESIAVNGVCLTIKTYASGLIAFDVSPETLQVTNLGALKRGDSVNIERALLTSARLGGHYVCGHVDTVGQLKNIRAEDNCVEIIVGDFNYPQQLLLIPKGSITLDGVSLTINKLESTQIYLMLVPHTLANTTLKQLQIGRRFNIEFDYFARIIAHQLTISGQLTGNIPL